jgi:hypothetical protein
MQLQVALHIFYQRHNPAMVQSASSIAAAHHGKVEELNTKLRAMYGADLNDIAGLTLTGQVKFRSHVKCFENDSKQQVKVKSATLEIVASQSY